MFVLFFIGVMDTVFAREIGTWSLCHYARKGAGVGGWGWGGNNENTGAVVKRTCCMAA